MSNQQTEKLAPLYRLPTELMAMTISHVISGCRFTTDIMEDTVAPHRLEQTAFPDVTIIETCKSLLSVSRAIRSVAAREVIQTALGERPPIALASQKKSNEE